MSQGPPQPNYYQQPPPDQNSGPPPQPPHLHHHHPHPTHHNPHQQQQQQYHHHQHHQQQPQSQNHAPKHPQHIQQNGKQSKFNVQEWLKTINVWDEKYDYVMHDDHWLTSKWSDSCEKCRGSQQEHQDLIDLNETFDLYRSALELTPRVPRQPPLTSSKIPKIPVRLSRVFDQLTNQ